MAIKKTYSQDKKVCQVNFTLPKEVCENFQEVSVVGDFNNWDPKANKFSQKNQNGSSSIELVLETGKEYQFKYLCDGHIWLNEPEADKECLTYFGNAKNSVLVL